MMNAPAPQLPPDMLMAMMTDPRATPQQKMAAMSALNAQRGPQSNPPMPAMQGDATGISTLHPAFAAAVRQEVAGGGQAAPAAGPAPSETTSALMSGAADARRVAGGFAAGGAVRGYADGGDVTTDLDPSTMTGGSMAPAPPAAAPAIAPADIPDDNDKHGYYALIRKQLAGDTGTISPQDKWMSLLQASLGTMAAASRPGATTLGSIGQGGAEGIAGLRQVQAQRAEERMKNASMAAGLAEHDQSAEDRKLALAQAKAIADATVAERAAAAKQASEDRAARLSAQVDQNAASNAIRQQLAGQAAQAAADKKAAGAPIPDLPPDELRKVLPKSEVATADAIIEGRLLPPNAGNRGAAAQRLLGIVTSLDPTFDATDTATRFNTAKFFSPNGQGGQAINSANTLVGHFGNLDKHIDDLGNTDVFTGGNTLKNYIDTHTGKMDPKTTAALGKYNADVEVASRELQKLLTRTGGTGEEGKELRAKLADSKTPTELHAVVQEYVELADSRLSALADQKTRGMGKDTNVWTDFYSPAARKTLQRVSPEYASRYTAPPVAGAADPAAAPAVGAAPAAPDPDALAKALQQYAPKSP